MQTNYHWGQAPLTNRMGYFGLSLEEEKSRLIEFGRFAQERWEQNQKLLHSSVLRTTVHKERTGSSE